MSNTTTTYADVGNAEINYEANHPKLQWLIILVPVTGVFVIYTYIRIRNKRKKRMKQLDEEKESSAIPSRISNVIPVAPLNMYNHNNRSQQTYNASEISLVRLSNSGIYINVAEDERRRQRQSNRRESTRPTTPPPVYSLSSPPVYEQVVELPTAVPFTETR